MPSIAELTQQWTLEDAENCINYNDIYAFIDFRESHYKEYHPTIGPFPTFFTRLQNWLDNAKVEEVQKILFRIIPELLYLSSEDFISLYRTAYNEQILQWLIEKENIRITESDLTNKLDVATKKAWFCPITDSMHIADFLHVNNINGQDYRPDWRSLEKFSTAANIRNYMEQNDFTYLVLLEDFVGSGSQMKDAVHFAANIDIKYQVLIVPLVVCPEGDDAGNCLEKKYANVCFKPVFKLQKEMFVQELARVGEPDLCRMIREVCISLEKQVQCEYSPFGYHNTGALFVMYTNCPDNTLELIHKRSDDWEPLFPRSTRI